jgi:hypothetical protein
MGRATLGWEYEQAKQFTIGTSAMYALHYHKSTCVTLRMEGTREEKGNRKDQKANENSRSGSVLPCEREKLGCGISSKHNP